MTRKLQISRNLLRFLNGSSYTVETLWYGFPVLGHFHHAPSVQHPVPKQVVELEAHTIPPPLVDFVVELVSLGGQDGQVLHVSPCQVRAGVDTHRGVNISFKGECMSNTHTYRRLSIISDFCFFFTFSATCVHLSECVGFLMCLPLLFCLVLVTF